MAMVLHNGSPIAFGPREKAFASLANAAVHHASFGAAKPGPSLAVAGAKP